MRDVSQATIQYEQIKDIQTNYHLDNNLIMDYICNLIQNIIIRDDINTKVSSDFRFHYSRSHPNNFERISGTFYLLDDNSTRFAISYASDKPQIDIRITPFFNVTLNIYDDDCIEDDIALYEFLVNYDYNKLNNQYKNEVFNDSFEMYKKLRQEDGDNYERYADYIMLSRYDFTVEERRMYDEKIDEHDLLMGYETPEDIEIRKKLRKALEH